MDKSLLHLGLIVAQHYRTLRHPNSSPHLRDYLGLLMLPAALGSLVTIADATISVATSAALVTVTGILAAFFFQLSVQLLNRAADLVHSSNGPSQATSEYAELLMTLSTNSVYSAVVAIAASVFALSAGIATCGWLETLLVCSTTVISTHLLWTLLLVMSRVYLLTRERLIAARTDSAT